jgi:hypothetical protein
MHINLKKKTRLIAVRVKTKMARATAVTLIFTEPSKLISYLRFV